jgi:hypothetical protein
MNLTTKKIQEMNLEILKELHLDRETLVNYFKKLKEYKYVDELNDLKYGGFIRWIPITDPENLPLNQCGIICDIIISDDGVYIVCKNFMHRHYRFKMDECLIFQKLSAQELIILSALDHLDQDFQTKETTKTKVTKETKDTTKTTKTKQTKQKEESSSEEESEESSSEEESEESSSEEDIKYQKYKQNSKLNNKI